MAYGTNAPFGLRPVKSISGGCWAEQTNPYRIAASADGTTTSARSIFQGDLVVWNATAANQGGGTITAYDYDTDGAAGDNATPVIGVFVSCEYFLPSGELVQANYWPASTMVKAGSDITAFVTDDPSVLYNVQVSTWTNVLNNARFTKDLVGQNFGVGVGGGGANLVPNNPTGGNTSTGQSTAYLATTFTANNVAHTVNTLPLKVMGYTPEPTNLSQPISYTADGTTQPFLNVIVALNNQTLKPGTTATVAV